MIFHELPLKGAYLIEMQKHQDERGFFSRTFCRKEFSTMGLVEVFVQANTALTYRRGTLRGMHYQAPPLQEAKLIRCIRGSIYDVIIDIRPGSPTFKKWYGRSLTEDDYDMIYVPEDFAHGYLALSDHSEVFYLVSQFYSPEHERGLRWNDPAFDIDWPFSGPFILSEKDKNWPVFQV